MSLFAGLYFYEIVLLVLGVILFVPLTVVLTINALKGKDIKGLLPFMGVVVLMIGFSSFQKIKYDNGVIEVEKFAHAAAAGDSTAVVKMDAKIAMLAPRGKSDPNTLLRFAKAKAIVGDSLSALTYADSALRAEPRLPGAREFKQTVLTPRVDLERTTAQFNANPRNPQLQKELTVKVQDYERRPDTSALGSISKANAREAIGDTAAARKHLDSAAVRNPKLAKKYGFVPIHH